ncbi:5-hydroxytryptamine receptor 1 [Chionoecetes opilio]|uniref:5-hydroxytryptamine receptor 1 n=1 Tax=Chionoecetes opilio TaxID=41210 RepID=A0A8J8WDU2_CHIOP|nr:5-hydroxytryptamine receptor 1 [Chionoecetes opilio]
MDWILGKVVDQSDCGASLSNTKLTDLVFADDAVIFAESLELLVMALEALHKEHLGLEVSWPKTKVQVPSRLMACGSSLSSAASGGSSTGSRWSLCDTNGKPHPAPASRTPNQQQPPHAYHNLYNACQSSNNGSGGEHSTSPRKRSQPTKIRLKFALAKERKASTTLGIIMSAFIVCWLPFFVLALVRPFNTPSPIPSWVSSLFLWLGYTNSLLNPIIYATLNKDFRKPFQATWRER